jgi:hypothetical protein
LASATRCLPSASLAAVEEFGELAAVIGGELGQGIRVGRVIGRRPWVVAWLLIAADESKRPGSAGGSRASAVIG